MNQLDSIKQFTTVVADSGDIESIRHYQPEDTTTNPSLLLKAAGLDNYAGLIDDALARAAKQGGNRETQVANACDKLAVNFWCGNTQKASRGASPQKSMPVSPSIVKKSIEKARHLVALYQEMGIDKSRILIKLASTREGIRAAEVLEKEGIHCNLTLLFSFARARACAEAGVFSDFALRRAYLRLVSGASAVRSLRG